MLSVNQMNAQIKLTEVWKSPMVPKYPIKLDKIERPDESAITRAITKNMLMEHGNTVTSQKTFINANPSNFYSISVGFLLLE